MRSVEEVVEKYLCHSGSVAVVGASAKRDRPVYGVMKYLIEAGLTLYPVNPGYAGELILGRECLTSLSKLSKPVDIIALFLSAVRQEKTLQQIEALDYMPVIWCQPGAENPEAEARFSSKGYDVVSGLCLMVMHGRICERGGL